MTSVGRSKVWQGGSGRPGGRKEGQGRRLAIRDRRRVRTQGVLGPLGLRGAARHLIVDFIKGFTDPGTGLGGDYGAELAVTAKLLAEFRSRAARAGHGP